MDFILMIRRLNAVNTPTGEVDQTDRPVEFVAPRPKRPSVPQPMPPRTRNLGCATREQYNRETARGEMAREGNAKEAAAASDDDSLVFEQTSHE
jgi:hypothetical protein